MTDELLAEQRMSPTAQAVGLTGFLVVCFGAAALGGIATGTEIDGWYRTLAKPSWQPPTWLFGPVWTVLYLLMAVAAWLVWRRTGFRAAAVPLSPDTPRTSCRFWSMTSSHRRPS